MGIQRFYQDMQAAWEDHVEKDEGITFKEFWDAQIKNIEEALWARRVFVRSFLF